MENELRYQKSARYPKTLLDKLLGKSTSAWFWMTERFKLKKMRKLAGDTYAEQDTNPLISVYVPTYNRAAILMERAVPTVLAQTYKNFEFIIVGDHCTDDTEEVVAKIDDPRIRFFNLASRAGRYPDHLELHWMVGTVTASNVGLGMVQGKWIARIDDDDIWTEDHLEKLLKFAEKGNYEFVSAAYDEERNGQHRIAVEDAQNVGGHQTWFYRSYLSSFPYNINCWRKAWDRVCDLDLKDRMYNAGVRIGYLDRVVASVLPRPGEATVGLDAYLAYAEDKNPHFSFDNPEI